MMQECWDVAPEQRPSFKSLHERLSKLVDDDSASVEEDVSSKQENNYYNNINKSTKSVEPQATEYHANILGEDDEPQIYN